MKSKQLLSVVFSLILVMGVSAGSAFAQTDDDLDDSSMDDDSSEYETGTERDEHEDERDEYEDEHDDKDEYGHDREYKDGKEYDLDDRLEFFCSMTDLQKRQLFADHPRLEQFKHRLVEFCDLGGDARENAIDNFIMEHFADVEYDDDHREILDRYCAMSDEDKRVYVAKHDKASDKVEKMNSYCTLDEDMKREFIIEHRDEYISHMKDKAKDHMKDKVKGHMKERFSTMEFDRFCAMTDAELSAATFEMEFVERASKWCDMTPDERKTYMKEHIKAKVHDNVKDHIKDKLSHMDYDGYCALTEAELAASTFDAEFVAKASLWCEMSPEERKASMKEHIRDMVHDKVSDTAPRLKAMIMANSVSDEKKMELKAKFMEKFGDKADKLKSELKMKYKDHVDKVKSKISDERKSAIHDRLAEMKAFKAEIRANSDLSVEEKQLLRADFIEKAKDMQLAWITPRAQMNAAVDISDIECREGYSLVMKASSGVAMCLKADTALELIDRGIAVPAN
ncbi:MAG: ABC transporter substrate-binding protein [Nitrosopumilus sp.]|nr:ABC transporter substrate-binding protein [Nitrosopumilus sp.]